MVTTPAKAVNQYNKTTGKREAIGGGAFVKAPAAPTATAPTTPTTPTVTPPSVAPTTPATKNTMDKTLSAVTKAYATPDELKASAGYNTLTPELQQKALSAYTKTTPTPTTTTTPIKPTTATTTTPTAEIKPKVTTFKADNGKSYDITEQNGVFSFQSQGGLGKRDFKSLSEAQNAIIEGNAKADQQLLDANAAKLNTINVKTGNDLANISASDASFLMNNAPEKYQEYLVAKQAKDKLDLVNNEITPTTDIVATEEKTEMQKLLESFGLSTDKTDLQTEYDTKYDTDVKPLSDTMLADKKIVDDYKRDYEGALAAAQKKYGGVKSDAFIRAMAAKRQEETRADYQTAIDNYNNSLTAYQNAVSNVDKQMGYKVQQASIDSQQINNFATMYGIYQKTPAGIAETYAALNPDMDTGTPAQQQMALGQSLDTYFKDFGYMIQRSKAQIISDVTKLAKQKGISISAALKENFLVPLQGKDEYKAYLAEKTGKGTIEKLSETTWLEKNTDGSWTFKSSSGSTSTPTVSRAEQIAGLKTTIESGVSAAQGVASITDGTEGGQCGYFMNNISLAQGGQKLFADTLASKIAQITPGEGAKVGNYVVMDTGAKLNDGTAAGHVGYVTSVNSDGTITIKDSNWNGDGKVSTHNIAFNDKMIKGYVNSSKAKSMTGTEDNGPASATATIDEIISYNDDVTRRKMSAADVKRIGLAKSAIMNNKNSNINDVMAFSNGGKSIGETQSKTLIKFDQAMTQLTAIQKQIKGMDTGPFLGPLRKMNPYDTDAQVLKAQLQGLVPTIARGIYGEVGVLTDNDVALYAKTLPTLTSTADTNKGVLAMTLDILAGGYKGQLRSLAGQGYDVSGLQGVYDNIKGQADLLRQQIGMTGTTPEGDDIF